ncbi:DUF6249 domain-containing protein [Mucilaginibacter litoreus]|uniref:DUF6249 domain-containing protein n=1 Tax=Mucilaginibacter litoreus TaxID=1048221 RepID=A0ABW3AVB7_9SPHI
MENIQIFGLLALACCFFIFMAWYFSHKARHRERLLMIGKGMDPDANARGGTGTQKALLKLGIVVIGLSIGIAIIGILVQLNALGRSGAIPTSILGLCGGAGLIVANRLTQKKN